MLVIGILALMILAGANTTIGCEGLTPGYWKNHTEAWYVWVPEDTLGDVFDVPSEIAGTSLLNALKFHGGPGVAGAIRILMRHAVAALLNIESPNVDWYGTTRETYVSELQDWVNTAINSDDRHYILDLADWLDEQNNMGLH